MRPRRSLALLELATAAASACGAQGDASIPDASVSDASAPDAPPEDPCESLRARAQVLLDQENARERFPGLVFALETPGCGTMAVTTGSVVLDPPTAMEADRIMTVSSVTKTFVAVVMLQLVEEGLLSLDDPIARWRPELPEADTMTVRHLLSHRSGLRDHWVLSCGGQTHDELVTCVASLGLRFEPGTSYFYSNTGYTLLGLIVEAVTHETLHHEIRTRVLEPLALTDTLFLGDPLPAERVMHTYSGTQDITGQEDPFRTWACADMLADADDLTRFFRTLFVGNLLTAASVAEMTTFSPTDGFPPGSYGLGLIGDAIEDGQGHTYRLWGNGGRGDAMTNVSYLPELDAAAALFVNHRYTYANIFVPGAIFAHLMVDLAPQIPPG